MMVGLIGSGTTENHVSQPTGHESFVYVEFLNTGIGIQNEYQDQGKPF
jgi:hypothetical protein